MVKDIPEPSGVAEDLRQRSGLPGVHLGGAVRVRALIAVVGEESKLHYDTISQHFNLLTISTYLNIKVILFTKKEWSDITT